MVDGIGADEARLETVSSRINTIYDLQQKHRVTSVAELLALQEEYCAKLEAMNLSSENTARMEREIEQTKARCTKLAERITQGRKAAAPIISKSVVEMLQKLGKVSALRIL